jgi:hypothetical protein
MENLAYSVELSIIINISSQQNTYYNLPNNDITHCASAVGAILIRKAVESEKKILMGSAKP